MTFAGLDVHARSTHAAAIDARTGELRRARFGADSEQVVAWLERLPKPDRGRPDRLCSLPSGAGGGNRARGRCPLEDAARQRRPDQERPQGRRAPGPAAAGRAAAGDRCTLAGAGGTAPPLPRPRAGAARPDALPPPRLQAAAPARARLPGADALDAAPPPVAQPPALRRAGGGARLPRHTRRRRRARRPQGRPRRAPLAARARERVLAERRPPALLPRPGHALGARALPRGRRLRPLRPSHPARLLARARAHTRSVRGAPPPGRNHEDRLRLCTAAARRGGLALPAPPAHRSDARQPPAGPARARARDRLACPAAPARPLRAPTRAREARQRRHRRRRARARLFP